MVEPGTAPLIMYARARHLEKRCFGTDLSWRSKLASTCRVADGSAATFQPNYNDGVHVQVAFQHIFSQRMTSCCAAHTS